MVYRDLLLSSGGGITPNFQLVDSNGCANIIIGLGGTGIDCLKEVKKQVYNRIKPDDILSGIPKYQHIQFLAIDSDRYSINDETFAGIDPATEFFEIGCNDVIGIPPKVLCKSPSLRWLSDDISIVHCQDGAGAVRQVGRLLMMTNSDRIKETIIHKINSAMQGLARAKLNIHIFTGIGGGTGSGIFLDICYITRHIIEQLHLENRSEVFGYFFLPDVNIQRIHNDSMRYQIEKNGFAAMKELDHCMNFDKNGGEWNQEYESYKILSKQAPVDNAYLVSSIDIDGNIRTNGYKYAINVVADYVTESLIHPFCLYPVMPPAYYSQKKTGACYNYYALGGARAYVPYNDICTYLAARVFEAYKSFPVTNHDIDAFVSDNGLTYREILHELKKQVYYVPLVVLIGFALPLIPSLSSKISEELSRVKEVLQKNRLELERSVIKQIKNRLIEIATYQGKGTVYSSLFLRNLDCSEKDLGNVIDGYIIENYDNLRMVSTYIKMRERDMNVALEELQKAKLKRKKTRVYVSAVNSYYTELVQFSLYKEMEVFLNDLKCQINNLYENFFVPINTMLANVTETFNYNYKYLVENIKKEDKYVLKIVGLDDNEFKKTLDLAVESIDTERVVIDFVRYMIRESKELLTSNYDSKICATVSSFFIQNFGEFMYKNIDCYLQERLQAPTQNQLVDMLCNEIMIPLHDRAKPLFWTYERLNETGRFGYCFIPNDSVVLSEAASRMTQEDSCFRINRSGSSDSISMFTLYCGVPMYTYPPIFDYIHKYDQSTIAGVYIYEGTVNEPRDFRNSFLSEDLRNGF